MCWMQSEQTLGCRVDPVPSCQYMPQLIGIEYIRISEAAALLPLLLAVIFAVSRSCPSSLQRFLHI